MLDSQEAVAGELALVPPLLGSSQTLLNRDHWAVYYEVSKRAGFLCDVLALSQCCVPYD